MPQLQEVILELKQHLCSLPMHTRFSKTAFMLEKAVKELERVAEGDSVLNSPARCSRLVSFDRSLPGNERD